VSAARAEVETKLARIRAWLAQSGRGGLLLASPGNFAWVTGGGRNHVSLHGETGCGAVLVTPTDALLLANNIELARLLEEEVAAPECLTGREFPWWEPVKWAGDVGVAPEELVADIPVTGASLLAPAEGTALRNPLLPPEVERYRLLGNHTAIALTHAAFHCRPGLSEHQLGGLLAGVLYDFGCDPLVTLVAVDDRARRRRHPLPTARRLERYALLVVTARRHGLHVSASRLLHFGPVPADLAARHAACAAVDAAFLTATRPGAPLAAVFAAGQAAYAAAGHPEEWRLHHQGGPTGYAARDFLVGPDTPGVVLAGQALAWNPTVDGTKSEDTVLVTKAGIEVLSRTPDLPEVSVGGFLRPGIAER